MDSRADGSRRRGGRGSSLGVWEQSRAISAANVCGIQRICPERSPRRSDADARVVRGGPRGQAHRGPAERAEREKPEDGRPLEPRDHRGHTADRGKEGGA
jgi:hypothetical protein